MVATLWLLFLTPGLVALALGVAAWLWRRPRLLPIPAGDLLVLAAHPDDCAILAGEYAQAVAAAGGRIDVVYLTNGDADPISPRALQRMAEARTAWAVPGVPADQLHFLNLPNSPLAGPSILTAAQLDSARQQLAQVLGALSADATVIFNAPGEAHVDHRTARQLLLDALALVGRPDLRLLQAAQYNDYYSLWHGPVRALRYVLRSLPMVARLIKPSAELDAAHPAAGPRLWRLPHDPQRRQAKHELLRAFVSENGELLVKLFGAPDRWQVVTAVAAPRTEPRGYLRLGERRLGVSVLLLWLSICGLTVMTLRTVLVQLHQWAQGLESQWLARSGSVLLATLALLGLVWALARPGAPERRVWRLALALGLAAGLWC